ncbi:coiled-coil domain-containing protein 42 homolog isoform X2 [Electrophorus electricus]|uniref:coiled-coil domain-containing protein 42 homolog isoform X2 n=1 Tax=Electrophorus electricus TaxID=8005 RepID=UPI0015CF9A55|nr:coiled-coil domain-containing protein 42 homolog isoform X2 [Electrophorus electricus]
MSLNLEDYFRTVFEEQLLMGEDLGLHMQGGELRATRLLDKQKQLQQTDEALRAQQEESDTKRVRGWEKAEAERASVGMRHQELQHLHTYVAALLARKEQLQARVDRARIYWDFLDSVLKKSKKFEDARQLMGHFSTLVSMREHLERRRSEVENRRVSEGSHLRHYVQEQDARLLQYNNTLSQLQAQLDGVLSQALRWESTWNHVQATAAKETLILVQIKVVTLNLYRMTGGVIGGAEGVDVDDTLEQLERIHLYIQNRVNVVSELRSDTTNRPFKQSDWE